MNAIKFKQILLTVVILFAIPNIEYSQNIQQGIKAIENEKFGLAKKIFTDLTVTDAEAYYYLGDIFYSLSKKDSAKINFEKGITKNPKIASNYVGLGKLMLDEKNTIGAINFFEKAKAISSSKNSRTFMLIGDAYLHSTNKDINQAIIELNTAIELDKKNTDAYILLGDALLEQYDGGQAMTSYETAVEINPSYTIGYLKIGELYAKVKSNKEALKEALKAFQKCITVDSTFVPAYRELGELYHWMGQDEKAKETYKKYISLAENNVTILSRYASFLFLSNDYKNTIDIINQILLLDSSNIILSRLIGYSNYEQGSYPEGLKFMENFFLKIDQNKIIASDYEYYGKLLAKVGSDSLAIINFNKAISTDSSKIELHGEIAQIYFKKKKYIEAANEYELKIKSNATVQDYFFMGKSYLNGKDYVKADSAFSIVNEKQNNYSPAWLLRARANSYLDNTSENGLAKPYYEKFVELATADSANIDKNNKNLVEAHSYLGYYYFLQKDNEKSRTNWEAVKSYEPDNKQAITALKNIK